MKNEIIELLEYMSDSDMKILLNIIKGLLSS